MKIKTSLAKKENIEELIKFFKENHDDPIDFVKERIFYYIKNHFIVLARDLKNNKLIGHLFFQAKENPSRGAGEFEAVYIIKEYRGKGAGKKLIGEALRYSRTYFREYGSELRCLFLFTRSSNEVAIKIYEKYGFKKKAIVGKIFRDNEPEELFMIRFF
jgi:ribosomal protein S18 acetylase RimI-like enzyme